MLATFDGPGRAVPAALALGFWGAMLARSRIPPLAWIPLAIVWLGLDNAAKVMVIFVAAFVLTIPLGLTYGPQYSASTDGSRLGQIRAIPQGVVPGVPADKDVVYFPYNSGNLVKLAMSLDGGETQFEGWFLPEWLPEP